MKNYRVLLMATLAMLACSKEELTPSINDGSAQIEQSATPSTGERVIKFSASAGDPNTKAVLGADNMVLWQQGDAIRVVKDEADDSSKLRIVLNTQGSGFGIKVDNGNETQIRYDDIKVEIGGEDITDQILSTSPDNNKYRIGITNSNEHYQYCPVGSTVTAEVYRKNWWEIVFIVPVLRTDYYITIARCTSGKNEAITPDQTVNASREVVITFTNLRYKQGDRGQWISVTKENSGNLVNGSEIGDEGIKDCKEFYWRTNKYDLKMNLDKGEGTPSGEFKGITTLEADVENSHAIFPYSSFRKFYNGTLDVDLKQTQKYSEDSFDTQANIMIGEVENQGEDTYGSHLKNMLGVLELTLTTPEGIVAPLKSIAVTDKAGKMLWGRAAIPAASFKNGISNEMLTGGTPTITLDCTGASLSSTPTNFYFVVPSGSFSSGLDVTVTDSQNNTAMFSASKANTIAVNVIKAMPAKQIQFTHTVNLESADLQWFLANANYTSWGQTSILYNNTTNQNRVKQKDGPASYAITLPQDSNYTVTLTDNTAKNEVYTNRSFSGSSYEFINLIPGRSYSYVIKDNAGNTVSSDKFNTTGRIRMAWVDDTWNVRDLGGWTGINGRPIVYEWLYRGGSLNGYFKNGTGTYSRAINGNPDNYEPLSATSMQQLADLKVGAELDLRHWYNEDNDGNDESHKYCIGGPYNNSNRAASGPHTNTAQRPWEFFQIDTAPAQSNPGGSTAIVQDVAWIIDQVINKNHPVYFHCKSGADRTGIVAVTILSLLGVSEGDLAREYEITNFSREYQVISSANRNNIRAKYTNQENDSTKHPYPYIIKTLNKGSLQQNAYFYLNQQFASSGKAISSTDLDRFIAKMLGMDSYTQPGGVVTNNTLASIHGDNN